MPIDGLGPVRVTTAGTPVQVVAGQANIPLISRVHGVLFQVLPTNTGRMYVGKAGMVKAAFTGVLDILAAPGTSDDAPLPSFSAALTWSPNNINLGDLYLDADVSGDGVLVTFLMS